MTTNIDIKALAKEIAKHCNASTICDHFEELIDECDPDIEEYFTIEDGVEDGFLGFEDWSFDIRFTPDVKYHLMGGYIGCDLSDCDHIVDEIKGIDYVAIYSVAFYDSIGNEYEFSQKQNEELEKELMKAIYEV